MNLDEPYLWNLSVQEAREVQKNLAHRVRIQKIPERIKTVAGCDVAYDTDSQRLTAGMVVLNFPDLTIVDEITINEPITFPYIPGYLSFREAPAIINLIKQYEHSIDLFIFDGHGIAHPRSLGIAAHIGVLLDIPSIGCAKKKLIGTYETPEEHKGSQTDLIHKGRIIGRVLRSKDRVKPVFVSVGHKVNLDDSVNLILRCCTKYRLPEPTRLADIAVARAKKFINIQM
jgi:deoxyribonuclease V